MGCNWLLCTVASKVQLGSRALLALLVAAGTVVMGVFGKCVLHGVIVSNETSHFLSFSALQPLGCLEGSGINVAPPLGDLSDLL